MRLLRRIACLGLMALLLSVLTIMPTWALHTDNRLSGDSKRLEQADMKGIIGAWQAGLDWAAAIKRENGDREDIEKILITLGNTYKQLGDEKR